MITHSLVAVLALSPPATASPPAAPPAPAAGTAPRALPTSPSPSAVQAEPKADAAAAEHVDSFFDSGGVRIRYVSARRAAADGEKREAEEAVVLIHGWMADSSMWGRDLAGKTKLDTTRSEGLRLIAVDCRGHGLSDKLYDPALCGPHTAEDVVRLLDHLKIEKAHLVGYSSGAYIAGYIAAKHPGRVRSLVYAAQAPIVKTEATGATGAEPADAGKDGKQAGATAEDKPPEAEAVRPGHAAEVEVFARAVEEGRDLGEYIRAVMPKDRPTPTAEQASAMAKFMFHGKDVKALAAAGRGFKHMGVPLEELKACGAPVLFIHGSKESDAVKERVKAVHEQLGRGEVIIIEGGDHMTTLAKPAFGEAILAFIRAAKTK